MTDTRAVAGILLTGGASRRLGVDKASLVVDGETLAARAARVLTLVCAPVIEVGRGRLGRSCLREAKRSSVLFTIGATRTSGPACSSLRVSMRRVWRSIGKWRVTTSASWMFWMTASISRS